MPSPQLINLHLGQQEAAAGAVIAMRLVSPSAIAAIAPHVLATAEGSPSPQQRLALLSDTFFCLLVRPACSGGGGRAARSTNDVGIGAISGRQGAARSVRGIGGGSSAGNAGARRPLVSEVLEQDWFVSMMSETPRGWRRLMFREELVAALATACAQVCVFVCVGVRKCL